MRNLVGREKFHDDHFLDFSHFSSRLWSCSNLSYLPTTSTRWTEECWELATGVTQTNSYRMCYSMHWMILVVEFTSIFSHSCLFVFSFCGFSSAEFLLPFFSCSCSLPLKSPTFLGENIIIWVKTSSFKWWFFHLISLLKEKRCHFLTFIWQLESKRARVRGKRNHEFRT